MQLHAFNVIAYVQINGVRLDLGRITLIKSIWNTRSDKFTSKCSNCQFDSQTFRLNSRIFIRFKLNGWVLICAIEWKTTRYIYGDKWWKINRWKNIFNRQPASFTLYEESMLKISNIDIAQRKIALIAVYHRF